MGTKRSKKSRQLISGIGVRHRHGDYETPGPKSLVEGPEITNITAHGVLNRTDDPPPDALQIPGDVDSPGSFLAVEDPDIVAFVTLCTQLLYRLLPNWWIIEDRKQPMTRTTHELGCLG